MKIGRAVMGNWCFGTDLWIMELFHSHMLDFVKNQGVPEQRSDDVHVYSRGLL